MVVWLIFAQNVVSFGIGSSSSIHSVKHQMKEQVENMFSINFTNLKTNFTLKGLTFDQSKQICKFKAFDNIPP